MSYGYNSYGSDRKAWLPENGIEVDTSKNILRINVCKRKDYYDTETINHEFKLIRHIICAECKSIVSAYAKGSVAFLEETHGVKLFAEPWENHSYWQLLKSDGAFALVANNGHKFELDRRSKSLEPQCFCQQRELAS
jgi:hypothetical protein